jgi:Fe-S-cluster-containing hydrogenase component 2
VLHGLRHCQPCIGIKETACVDACPVQAIYAEGDLPDKWDAYVQINAEHYDKPEAK